MGLSSSVQMNKMMLRMAVISALCVAYSMAAAPAPAPAPQIDCNAQISVLLSCVSYLQGTEKVPPPECCTGLSSVVKNYPSCLCQLLNSPAAGSAGVNVTAAVELPARCGIPNANVSQCSEQTPPPMTGATTPGTGGTSTPRAKSPSSSTFVSTPTNMVHLVFVATCLLVLVN